VAGLVSLDLSITGQVKSLIVAGTIALDNTRLVGFDLGSKFMASQHSAA
jgi:hypothetical protein